MNPIAIVTDGLRPSISIPYILTWGLLGTLSEYIPTIAMPIGKLIGYKIIERPFTPSDYNEIVGRRIT
jgi:hypothetical protein